MIQIDLFGNVHKKSEKDLAELAYHDSLTGFYNRNMLEEFRSELDHMHNLILLMLDIDHLKTINDLFGHEQGDIHICLIAKFVQQTLVRFYKTSLFRLGGDEFLAIMECNTGAFSPILKTRLDIMSLNRGFSFGIIEKSDKENLRDAMLTADKRMYEMKKDRHIRKNSKDFSEE